MEPKQARVIAPSKTQLDAISKRIQMPLSTARRKPWGVCTDLHFQGDAICNVYSNAVTLLDEQEGCPHGRQTKQGGYGKNQLDD